MVEVEYFLKENDLTLFMNSSYTEVYFKNIIHHLKNLNIKKLVGKKIYKINSSNINMYNTFIIEGEDKLIIEFETEEDAFYFKMKYC